MRESKAEWLAGRPLAALAASGRLVGSTIAVYWLTYLGHISDVLF